MTIGILGAMPEEIRLLTARLEQPAIEKKGGVEFHIGTLYGKKAVICCGGMGKVNAAAATQLLITAYGAEAIICNGIAGNTSKEIGIGDIVIGKTVFYHDATISMISQCYPNLEAYTAADHMVAAAEQACRENDIRFLTGRIATGDQFIEDEAVKNDIVARTHPDCVEMEGAAVAHVAAKNDVPFVVLRTMSDECNEYSRKKLVEDQFDITEYCQTAAKVVAETVKRI